MKQNMGSIDKIVRVLAAVVIGVFVLYKSNHWYSGNHSWHLRSCLPLNERNRFLPVVSAAEALDDEEEGCIKEPMCSSE